MLAPCFMLRHDFNPRPPRGGRQEHRRQITNGIGISIHAPREGGDAGGGLPAAGPRNFNPRPPRGGRPGHSVSG